MSDDLEELKRDAARWRALVALDSLEVDFYGPMESKADRPYGGRWVCGIGADDLTRRIDSMIDGSAWRLHKPSESEI